MSVHGHEDLRNHSFVAEQNALHFGEDREARIARLRGEQAPKSREELEAKAVPPAGRYSLVGVGAYTK